MQWLAGASMGNSCRGENDPELVTKQVKKLRPHNGNPSTTSPKRRDIYEPTENFESKSHPGRKNAGPILVVSERNLRGCLGSVNYTNAKKLSPFRQKEDDGFGVRTTEESVLNFPFAIPTLEINLGSFNWLGPSTNRGNRLRETKAEKLSSSLGIPTRFLSHKLIFYTNHQHVARILITDLHAFLWERGKED